MTVFGRYLRSRYVLAAVVAALSLSVVEPLAAAGAGAPSLYGVATKTASSDVTDVRYVRRRSSNAAGLAFMGLALGTIGAIVAQQRRNDYYDNNGYPYGYAPQYYAGPRYYGGPRYHRY